MNQIKIAALVAVALLATGCNTTTKEDYALVQTALKGSAKQRASSIKTCTDKIAKESLQSRREVAILIDVETKDVAAVFCRRMLTAVANGRLSQADFEKGFKTPNYIKVIQGR